VVAGSAGLTLLEQRSVAIPRRAALYSDEPVRLRLSYGMPEDELRLIRSMPREFLDGLGVGVTLVDVQTGQTLFTNATFCKMLGYTSDELARRRMTLLKLMLPQDGKTHQAEQKKMLADGGDRFNLDERFRRKDGSILWALVTVTAIRDSRRKVRWTTCVVEDASEKRDLQLHLAFAQEISGLATWNWAVRSNSTNTSGSYNSLFGQKPSATAPSIEQFIERVHPDDRKAVTRNVRRALTGGAYEQEYRIILPSGEVRWMRGMATSQFNAAGEVTNLVGATFDITEIKSKRLSDLAPKRIRDFVQYIEDHCDGQLSIAGIAAEFNLSKRSIHNYFASLGMTPMTFIKQTGLRLARQKLCNPDRKMTVASIASQCGFKNHSHFSRDYRNEFGELPSETLKRYL
jgi:PAS domain S-box-containing protein